MAKPNLKPAIRKSQKVKSALVLKCDFSEK